MNKLEKFMGFLCGNFDNEEQLKARAMDPKLAAIPYPKAKHINGICNEKIQNMPAHFEGYFVIEESYYEVNGRQNSMPHLFLFKLNDQEQVVLTSYEIPEGISKEDLRNDNSLLQMDYHALKISEKFMPMVYEEADGAFQGRSVSDFGNGLIFTLEEKTCKEGLYVSEVFKRNGKVTFGFDEPISYKRK